MLRKGIVALMMIVMTAGSIQAEDGQKSNRLMNFLRGPSIGRPNQKVVRESATAPKSGGVTHAVVEDVEKQVPEIRQTSNRPEPPQLQPAESTPQPTPVYYAQVAGDTVVSPARTFGPEPAGREFVAEPNVVWGAPQMMPPQAMQYSGPSPIHFASNGHVVSHSPVAYPNGGLYGNMSAGPQGGLYPTPKPGIPLSVGGTAIPNAAFHPHEMMHAHRYKAMYGPFYHKVNGKWIVTPFGVWSRENWKLQGTTVDVKYKSHISPFAFFCRPIHR